MLYNVKFTAQDNSEIQFGPRTGEEKEKDLISYIDIFIDTIKDDVSAKTDAVLAKIDITGKIDENTQERLINLFKWSISFGKDKAYRTVEIEILDGEVDSLRVLRKYIFEKMFVVDYKEVYIADNEKTDDDNHKKPYFELKLTQLENNLKTIDTYQ